MRNGYTREEHTMGSVVLDLQQDALDRKCPVSDLLRRALVVARKLNLTEFQTWISNELGGYNGAASEVPPYRNVHGQIKARNPFRGWIPLVFEDTELTDLLSHRLCGQSVAELEHLADGKKPGSMLMMPFPPATEARLMATMQPVSCQPMLFLSASAIVKILDTVKTTVLNWTLRLEQDGILGENLSFSVKDKERASEVAGHVTNFFGPVSNAQVASAAQNPTQIVVSPTVNIDEVKALIAKIKSAVSDLDLNADARAEFQADLATVESQTKSPKPKAGIIRQSLSSIRSVLEGAGGNVLGALIAEVLKKMVGG
jgi:hypothetical protein